MRSVSHLLSQYSEFINKQDHIILNFSKVDAYCTPSIASSVSIPVAEW